MNASLASISTFDQMRLLSLRVRTYMTREPLVELLVRPETSARELIGAIRNHPEMSGSPQRIVARLFVEPPYPFPPAEVTHDHFEMPLCALGITDGATVFVESCATMDDALTQLCSEVQRLERKNRRDVAALTATITRMSVELATHIANLHMHQTELFSPVVDALPVACTYTLIKEEQTARNAIEAIQLKAWREIPSKLAQVPFGNDHMRAEDVESIVESAKKSPKAELLLSSPLSSAGLSVACSNASFTSQMASNSTTNSSFLDFNFLGNDVRFF